MLAVLAVPSAARQIGAVGHQVGFPRYAHTSFDLCASSVASCTIDIDGGMIRQRR